MQLLRAQKSHVRTSINSTQISLLCVSFTMSSSSRKDLWNEVVEFLKSMKFDEYIETFKLEGFDRMDAICDLNMDDLRDMKVKKGHAKILLTQINLIKAKNTDTNNNQKTAKLGGIIFTQTATTF